MNPHPLAALFPLMDGPAFADLCADIGKHGLCEPIVLHEGKVLDGRNRLRACLQTGTPPVFREWDGSNPLAFVLSANLQRRHLNESQRAMVAARVATLPRGTNQHTAIAASSQGDAAGLLNVSVDSIQRARKVICEGSPELVSAVDSGLVSVSDAAGVAELPAEDQCEAVRMVNEGRAKRLLHATNEIHRARIAARAVAPPDGLYDVIVIDPAWPMEKIERDVQPNQVGMPYPTMSLEAIGEIEIPCAEVCHVWLWTTKRFKADAHRIMEGWGIVPVHEFIWHKPGGFQPFGQPQYNCEYALYGRHGAAKFVDTHDFPLCFSAPRGAHSEKPDLFFDMVRRVTSGRRLDMFARRQRAGWDVWGNEVEGIQPRRASA